MNKIKRNDNVFVLSGKDKGKTGTVRRVMPKENRAYVVGVNMVRKHRRPRTMQESGGIIDMEAPINLSNLAVVCPSCGKKTRVGIRILQDGGKTRFCKQCDSELG